MSAKRAGYGLTAWLSRRLPRETALGMARRCADAQFAVSTSDRQAVTANLRAILGSQAADAARAREVFRNFGRYLVEFFTMHQAPEPSVDVEGWQHLNDARRSRQGLIVLTGHLGNWELGAVVLKRLGLPMTVVALPHEDAGIDALFNDQRRRCGIPVIPLGPSAARQSLRCLRDGGAIGILGDREFGHNGVPTPMFHRQLTLPAGPAVLSARSGSPLLPMFLLRTGPAAFRLCIEPPIAPPHAPARAAVRSLVLAYGRVLERFITQCPEQWLIFQPLLNAR